MDGLTLAVIWINTGFAFVAGVLNIWSSRNDEPRRRGFRVAVAFLAFVYGGGYLWLALGADVALWSGIFRGVTIPTWVVVWWMPAIAGPLRYRQDLAHIESVKAEVVDAIKVVQAEVGDVGR